MKQEAALMIHLNLKVSQHQGHKINTPTLMPNQKVKANQLSMSPYPNWSYNPTNWCYVENHATRSTARETPSLAKLSATEFALLGV